MSIFGRAGGADHWGVRDEETYERVRAEVEPLGDLIKSLTREIDALAAERDKLVEFAMDDPVMGHAIQSKLRGIQEALEAKSVERAGVQGQMAGVNSNQADIDLAIRLIREVVCDLLGVHPEQQRDIIHGWIEKVSISYDSMLHLDLCVRIPPNEEAVQPQGADGSSRHVSYGDLEGT